MTINNIENFDSFDNAITKFVYEMNIKNYL